jgi:hypothetical protein
VILGLAETQILQGFRRLLLYRSRVTVYWPVVLWAITLPDSVNVAFHGVFALGALIAETTRRPWVHEIYAPLAAQGGLIGPIQLSCPQ